MLLKELELGKRFMFEDRTTPLALAAPNRGNFSSMGTFELVRYAEYGCPVLRSSTGKEITLVSSTYFRSVLIIL